VEPQEQTPLEYPYLLLLEARVRAVAAVVTQVLQGLSGVLVEMEFQAALVERILATLCQQRQVRAVQALQAAEVGVLDRLQVAL
jgi:hypothetical protein